ncbi:MAG: hypothetical protein H6852_08285 [Geminicoccaceae bacterium]|nr:hypothetical protein [Geminicoccaceae bacterium]HRY24762.1 hypothetical protein [Geminicoccaceae bacterium]
MPTDVVGKLFAKLADPANHSAAIIEAALNLAHADGLSKAVDLDPWLERFVEASIRELEGRYMGLFSLFWTDDAIGREEFAQYVTSCFEPPSSRELTWPWPITEPGPSKGGSPGIFEHEHSGLWLCGYRTGKTKGLPDNERKLFLAYFFRQPLPPIVAQYHDDDYGAPGTEKRLRKMANLMAACCRNFKSRDRRKLRVAIAHYEEDLEFLRSNFYRPGMFPWPPIEP